MDRTTELKTDYEKMSALIEKFEKRQALVVEGEWYLFEIDGRVPSVINTWAMADHGYTLEMMRNLGYTYTLVTIFRKER